MMNFYRFLLYKGEKTIDGIVVYGDAPRLKKMVTKMEHAYDIPRNGVRRRLTRESEQKIGMKFVPALGLALKGSL